VRRQALGRRARLLTIPGNKTLTCGYIGALGGTRTPNLLIRRFLCGRTEPFRWVRDLGLVSLGCPRESGLSQGCSSVWLPAWLPWPNRAARDPMLRKSVCATGQPARPQVSRCVGLSASDRKYPALTGRSGTQRARRLRLRMTADSAGPGPRRHLPAWSRRPVRALSCPAPLPRTRLLPNLTADGFCQGAAEPIT
jgi:hypothetical protein